MKVYVGPDVSVGPVALIFKSNQSMSCYISKFRELGSVWHQYLPRGPGNSVGIATGYGLDGSKI
jgi:hypothetical protein